MIPDVAALVDALGCFKRAFESKAADPDWHMSEEGVRECLATGLRAALDLLPGAVAFERPPGSGRIDLWVEPMRLAIEVKFHRPIPSAHVAETLPERCFPLLLGDVAAPRTSVEIHLTAGRGGPPGPSTPRTLAETIDLSALGTGRSQPPTKGHFATSGDVPLTAEHAPGDLLAAALRRMALDWGYLDPDEGLPAVGSISA